MAYSEELSAQSRRKGKNSFLDMKLSSLSAESFKCLVPGCCILLAGSLNSDFGIHILFYLKIRGVNLLFNSQKKESTSDLVQMSL